MQIFLRYVFELAIIIPDAIFIFLPVLDELRWRGWITYTLSGILLPLFVIFAAWVSAEQLLPVIPVLVWDVSFLFLIFFFSVRIPLGQKLFCFFNSVMLGAFCLFYAIILMASIEAANELWETTKLMCYETSLISLVISILIGVIFFKFLTEQLPMLLAEKPIGRMWDFLFLIPLTFTFLISWLTPVAPENLLVGRLRIVTLVIVPVLLLLIFSIYYLLWWIATRFSESAKLQQENTLLQMERKRYEELRNYMDETKALRHDFRQHLLVINQFSNSGQLNELQNYLAQFNLTSETKYKGYCDNIAVDAVASYYTSFAKNQNTKIEWKLNLPHELPLKEAEYCVILGNLVENALRAVKNLPEERRNVKIISSLLSEQIIGLSIDNPYAGKIKFNKNGLPKSERDGHGIGLTSVFNSVKRHEGTLNISTSKNIFSVDIVLNCNL